MRSHAHTTVPLLTFLWGLGGVAPLCTPVRRANASEPARNDLSRGPEDLRARCERFRSLKISKTKNRHFSHFWTKCESFGELFRPNFAKMICTIFKKTTVGVSEPVPSLSVPLVSVLWLEPTLRNPVFAYPAIRSPLLCWCCLSQSGLSRRPGKPGDRLVGSTESPNKKHHPDSNP